MEKIVVDDLVKYCDCEILIGNKEEEIKECFIDSRKNTNKGTFFGIKGEKNDGSLFYKEAFDNGANICVLSFVENLDLNGYEDKTVVIAKDPKEALQKLAAYKRSLFKGKVVAITGSVGKTSTKEMVSNVLEGKYKVLKTLGNQNSQLGLPLTILRLRDEDVMVLEMGMNNLGQIHNLSMIAKPDISIITNVYDSHIGNLGSRDNILKAKLEIIDGMTNGILVINNDNDMLNKESFNDDINVITYGINNSSNYMAKNVLEHDVTTFDVNEIKDMMVKGGFSFVYNALAAIIVGKIFNIEDDQIKNKINSGINIKHRMEYIILKNNVTIIDDAYNASYESIKTALKHLNKFSSRKIAVLADVLELGKESKNIHKKIGFEVVKWQVDYLITIGKHSKYISKMARKQNMKRRCTKHFSNEKKARKFIKKLIRENDVILIKGSNGMGLINLIEDLKGN